MRRNKFSGGAGRGKAGYGEAGRGVAWLGKAATTKLKGQQ